MTAQTRSVPGPSFPNHHSPENHRSTRANLPVCRSGGAQLAPEFRPRSLNHRCYAVRSKQPFRFILLTATVRRSLRFRQPRLGSPRLSYASCSFALSKVARS